MTSLTLPSRGDINWDVALNAALSTLNSGKQDVDSLLYSVKDHGAVANGSTSDSAAINALMAAVPSGAVVYMPPAVYGIDAPLRIPPGVTLMMTHGNHVSGTGEVDPQAYIKVMPTFSGNAAIELVDQATGGYSGKSCEQRLFNLSVDGSAGPAGVDGIRATGYVHGVIMRDISIRSVTGRGIFTTSGSGASPYSWRMQRVVVKASTLIGVSLNGLTDSTLTDVEVIGGSSHGFFLSGMANSHLTNCRAEWSTLHGFYITGSWGTGTGSGSATFTGCSTDRNAQHGVLVDATGSAPLVFNGLLLRRDGRNGGSGGGGYAGFAATSATMPILIGSISNYPGVDDDGTATSSPQYGMSLTGNTSVSLNNGYLHAATAAFNNGGSNTTLRIGENMQYAVGSTASPTAYAGGKVQVVKSSSTPVTANTVLAADPHLTTSLPPSSTFRFRFIVVYDADTAGDFQWGLTGPSGATAVVSAFGLPSSATGNTGSMKVSASSSITFTDTYGGAGVGTKVRTEIEGTVTTSTTAGAFALQWAQGTSSASATTVYAGSFLTLEQIS